VESYGGLDGGVRVSLYVFYFFVYFFYLTRLSVFCRLLSSTNIHAAPYCTNRNNSRVLPLHIRSKNCYNTSRFKRKLASQPPSHPKSNGLRVCAILFYYLSKLTLTLVRTSIRVISFCRHPTLPSAPFQLNQSSRLSHSTPALSSSHPHPSSPYPPYILTLLILTFPPLLFVFSSAFFPVRSLCLILGLGPFVYTHPLVRPFHPYIGLMVEGATNYIIKMLIYVRTLKHVYYSRWVLGRGTPTSIQPCNEKDGEFIPLRTILERVMDDDKLSDKLWRAEMREVELWENERFAGMFICSLFFAFRPLKSSFTGTGGGPSTEDPHPPTSSSETQTRSRTDSSTSISPSSSPTASPTRTRHLSLNNPILQTHQTRANASGWSKSNLRPAERGPWTRRRDGWGGVGAEIRSVCLCRIFYLDVAVVFFCLILVLFLFFFASVSAPDSSLSSL
jgi:hypothetical protein